MKLVLTLQKIVRIWCRTASFLLQIYSFRNKTGLISVWLSQSAQTYQTICATELQTSFCYVYRLQQTPTSSDETVPFCVSCCGMCLAPLCSFITSQALKHNISHPCVPCSSARGHWCFLFFGHEWRINIVLMSLMRNYWHTFVWVTPAFVRGNTINK